MSSWPPRIAAGVASGCGSSSSRGTIDSLLAAALEKFRPGFRRQTHVLSYDYKRPVDVPDKIEPALVYHMVGSRQTYPNFAVWEEDYLEFLCGLIRHHAQLERLFLLLAACLERQGLLRMPLYVLQTWLCCAALAKVAYAPREAQPLQNLLTGFRSSPITGIHLWFDRQVTDFEHAVLLDRTIQWMFHKSKFQNRNKEEREGSQGSYVELVVSASKGLVQKSREEVLEIATREMAEFFPAVKQARVVKAAVIKEIYATYAIVPGLDEFRPVAKTGWPGILLAGDWTATGLPATLESAVRSGNRAAEVIASPGRSS